MKRAVWSVANHVHAVKKKTRFAFVGLGGEETGGQREGKNGPNAKIQSTKKTMLCSAIRRLFADPIGAFVAVPMPKWAVWSFVDELRNFILSSMDYLESPAYSIAQPRMMRVSWPRCEFIKSKKKQEKLWLGKNRRRPCIMVICAMGWISKLRWNTNIFMYKVRARLRIYDWDGWCARLTQAMRLVNRCAAVARINLQTNLCVKVETFSIRMPNERTLFYFNPEEIENR